MKIQTNNHQPPQTNHHSHQPPKSQIGEKKSTKTSHPLQPLSHPRNLDHEGTKKQAKI